MSLRLTLRVSDRRSGCATPVPGLLNSVATAGGADEACGRTSGRWCPGAAGAQHRVSARLPDASAAVCALPVSWKEQSGGYEGQ